MTPPNEVDYSFSHEEIQKQRALESESSDHKTSEARPSSLVLRESPLDTKRTRNAVSR